MKYLLTLALTLVLGACNAITVEDYSNTAPPLDLRSFLDGDLKAYGMLQDRSGRMTRRFTATLQATWEGDRGTLTEHFSFDDGEQQERVWHLVHDGQGHYSGTAGDVSGLALGKVSGAVFNWQYRLNVPYRDDSILLNLDDWLYLVDENHLLNRTSLTRFGFRVGELTLLIEKL